MKPLFDEQATLLRDQLDKAVETMFVKTFARIRHDRGSTSSARGVQDHLGVILLSGGLGGSQYIANAVRGFLEDRAGGDRHLAFHPNILNTVVVQSEEPQLCVVKGLLHILFESEESKTQRKRRTFSFMS